MSAAPVEVHSRLRLHAVADQAFLYTSCQLHEHGPNRVAGRATARLMFVGEQPGDKEDRTGEPFVGPAGTILDRALEQLGIERRSVYLTNVVKHSAGRPPESGESTRPRAWNTCGSAYLGSTKNSQSFDPKSGARP